MGVSTLNDLRGIGKTRAEVFARAGIETLADLLNYFPASYRENRLIALNRSDPGSPCLVKLCVQSVPRISFFAGGRRAVRFQASDDSGVCDVVYFYQTYLAKRFCVGKTYYFYGRFKPSGSRYLAFSPDYSDGDQTLPAITPVYPLTKGLTQKMLQSAIAQVLPEAERIVLENLPAEVLREHDLMPRAQAVRAAHQPRSVEEASRARTRFAFEELFFFRLDLLLLQKKRGIPSIAPLHAVSTAPYFAALGFAPTEAQNRAIAEIFHDLIGTGTEKSLPAMHRLLQGDVGSGKTAVCAAAIYLTLCNGKKAALMAPTELLAEQHARKLERVFSAFRFPVYCLTGTTPAARRRQIDAALNAADPCLLVGTHALISDRVSARDLSLTVVDEQHRFGVRQRDTLLSKAAEKNLLVMSATPIPRTLALFLFSKDDVSTLDTLPPGRQPVETYYVGASKRDRVDTFVEKELNAGGRAYIVCPLIEESEESDLMAAQSRFEQAKARFKPYNVGFLHGKMSAAAKREAMQDFAQGKTRVLVSTTVIEIGIDVPEATVMCVENAERFGLATLHQLRGRVGRGSRQSYCILLSDARGKAARERLQKLCEIKDGFKLAEYDMDTRGPGDFFGVRQSGFSAFTAAREQDGELLEKASRSAQDFFEKTVDK